MVASSVFEHTVTRFAQLRREHTVSIKTEARMDNLSTFQCSCGTVFRPESRTKHDIDRHLAEAYAAADLLAVDEQRLREIVKSTVDRQPYDDHTSRQIRSLENAISREVMALLR